jgi:hypothetical protein
MQFQSSSILNFPITEIRFPQRDSAGVATQNNELRFRLQAMEQQAQLRDGAYLSIFNLLALTLVALCSSTSDRLIGRCASH